MMLSDLQSKDVINIKNGNNLGRIIDANVSNDGRLIYFVAEERKMLKRAIRGGETTFNYEAIQKIGEDVILVDL